MDTEQSRPERDADLVALGREIAAERTRAGLTQEQLAGAVGLSRSSINRYEKGGRDMKFGELRAIAAALGVRTSRLLRGMEEKVDGESDQ